MAINQAYRYLRTKFGRRLDLTPNDGPDVRLGDADDTFFHAMASLVVHLPLLLVKLPDHLKGLSILF